MCTPLFTRVNFTPYAIILLLHLVKTVYTTLEAAYHLNKINTSVYLSVCIDLIWVYTDKFSFLSHFGVQGHNSTYELPQAKMVRPGHLWSLICTMAQMAYFPFPYYFTIPNSEFRNLHCEFRNSEFGIVKYM